jgi:hypothetical protein
MENSGPQRKQLSPRTQAWVGLIGFLVAVVVAGTLPVGPQLVVLFAAGLGFGVFRLLQRCPSCEKRVARTTIKLGAGTLPIYMPLPPKKCEHCGHDLR